MIGLDTNVLVRYLVQDDAAQSRQAGAVIEGAARRAEQIYLSAVTMCELVWVLESAYERPRAIVAAALEKILRTAAFTLEHADHVRAAVMTYSSSPVDFADALVGRINAAAGCEHTVTFDRDLKRAGDFRVL
jgi:predicted nucleic-acid-binding protein